jgi:hypothetical protein
MRKLSLILLLLTTAVSCFAQQKTKVKSFHFLLGNWEMMTKSGKIMESWEKHRDSLTGKSFTIKGKDSVLTEILTIKKVDSNWLLCVKGFLKDNLGDTKFKLVSTANNTFTFENKENEFPQRISYQHQTKNAINAWIEGSINGVKRKVDFPYKRIVN